MARIYIDARTITAQPSGVGRYARSLLPELVEPGDPHEYVIVRHPSNRDPLGVPGGAVEEVSVDLRVSHVENALFGAWALWRTFREYGFPDLYHSLIHFLPAGITAATRGRPVVVTLHDLIWIDHAFEIHDSALQAGATRTFGRWAIPHALRRADHVISVSKPTAERATEWVPPARQSVVPHGVERSFFDISKASGSSPDWLPAPDRYVLAIGNDKPYKNLHRLVAAFAVAQPELEGEAKLVLIGDCEKLRPRIRALGLEEDVVVPGFVDDPGLQAALGGARLFVFPSRVEGFGLPVLEAMAAGVPVVVADREPMRSVAGDAALPVPVDDTEALADALVGIWNDPERRERLRRRGRKHASEFTWEETAAGTRAVYDRLLAHE